MSTLLPPPHPCAEELRAHFAAQGVDVAVHTAPPLVALYEVHEYTCPHSVDYWVQPSDAQVAQWRKDGVQ